MLEVWIGQPVLQAAVTRQQQQPLAVMVQSPGGIYAFHGDEVAERGSLLPRELAQHSKRFIENEIALHASG